VLAANNPRMFLQAMFVDILLGDARHEDLIENTICLFVFPTFQKRSHTWHTFLSLLL
jgi:hypothetical protein